MVFRRRLLAALAALAIAPPAHATQVIQMDTRDLVRSSSDIVVGSVDRVRSYWNANHTRILTDVTVNVGESLKGDASHAVTITQMGGVVDGMRLTIDGTPVFKPGEQAVLFLWRDAQGRRLVNGLAQGKFDIQRDASTGELLVRRSLDGLSLLNARTRAGVGAQAVEPRTRLDDFRRQILQALREDGR